MGIEKFNLVLKFWIGCPNNARKIDYKTDV